MKQKNTLGLIMALLILFSIGCGQTPDEHITKPDDVTLLATAADFKSGKKPNPEPVLIADTGETFGTDRDVRNAPPIADFESGRELDTTSVVMSGTQMGSGTYGYVLNDATITDDTLTLNVSYSGGCATHEFTLIAADSFVESSPVEMDISVRHNANGDRCRSIITEDRCFNLTPIKTLYQETYQQEAGTIILRLDGAPNGELTYEFEM